jgi:hypothetical protein
MGKYKLLDLDRDEKSIVRRALYQESRVGEQTIKEIFSGVQREYSLSTARLIEPHWETSVHPLYFWAYGECKCEPGQSGNYRACFDHVLKQVPIFHLEDLHKAFWYTVVDCEIDILVEDTELFLFLEAKIPVRGTDIDWYRSKHGAHQLVHQYVQGKLLKKLVVPEKEFALGTIGANNGIAQNIHLNETERKLLALVGYDEHLLRVPDFALEVLTG